MAKKNREELEAFAQKMHDEGAAGFAAGLTPWETWDDFEDRVGSRVWQGTAEHVTERKRPARSFGDRVLATMTVLAVAALAIGVAGVYINNQGSRLQLADNSTQLLPAAPSGPADTATVAGMRADGPAAAAGTPAGTDADSSMVAGTAPPPAAPSIQPGDAPSLPGTNLADDNLLLALNELAAASAEALPAAAPGRQAAGTDQDGTAAGTADDADTTVAALEESATAAAAAGIDSNSAPATMADDADTTVAALEEPATAAIPAGIDSSTPAAMAEAADTVVAALQEPATAAAATGIDSSTPAAMAEDADTIVAALQEPAAAAASAGIDSSSTPAAMADDAGNIVAALEQLPAPAAGARTTALPAPRIAGTDNTIRRVTATTDGNDMAAATAAQPAATGSPAPTPGTDTGKESDADTAAVDGEELPLATLNDLPAAVWQAQPVLLTPAAAIEGTAGASQSATPADSGTAQGGSRGGWSINLASYTKQSAAEQVRAEFLASGVAAEQVVAILNGKTLYRLQVTGFDSRQAALQESATIKEKLGLKDTWVTKH